MELGLQEKWMLIAEDLINEEDIFDLDELKHLIFDTYQHLEAVLTDKDSYPRNLLPLYKYLVQASQYLNNTYLESVPAAVSAAFGNCIEGLCYVIENGFDCGYHEHSLPLGLTRPTPAGCADSEADMSSYESFLKAFNDNVEYLKTIGYDEDEE